MSLLLALAAVGSAAAGVSAECVSVAAAAKDAGADRLFAAVKDVAASDAGMVELQKLITRKTPVKANTETTFFAPSDAAFKEVEGVVGTLDSDTFTNLVLNHVVDWKMDASEITAAAAAGEVVQTEVDNLLGFGKGNAGDLYVTPEDTHIRAQVTKSDIKTCAGMLHIVDTVLVPAAKEQEVKATGIEAVSELARQAIDAVAVAADQVADTAKVPNGRKLMGFRERLFNGPSPAPDCGSTLLGDLNSGSSTLGPVTTTASLGECTAECSTTPSCNAAVFWAGNCYLKSIDPSTAVVTPSSLFSSYILCTPTPPALEPSTGAECGATVSGDLNPGTPTIGGAMPVASLGACVTICEETAGCNAAIFNGNCYLKSVDATSVVVAPGPFTSQIVCGMPSSMGGAYGTR